jgi:hypothetical protein
MEKRSRRRIHDLVALAAFQGLLRVRRVRADIYDGQEQCCSIQGPDTEAQVQLSPDHQIQLATRGRSIQKCQDMARAPKVPARERATLEDSNDLGFRW